MQSNQEGNSSLGYLGDDFQYKLCKYLVEYPDFFNSIKTTLTPNAFTVPIVKTIISTMVDYSEESNSVPNYTTLKMLLNSKFLQQKDRDILSKEINKIQNDVTLEDREWVHKQAFNFFKQQELVKAINKAREILANGEFDNYDSIKSIIEKAMNNVHASEEMGHSPFENVDEIMEGNTRHPIPTGIKMIDERTNGGLGKGELGLICGASGFGKTSISTALASYAGSCQRPNGQCGFKVLYIFFEDTMLQIQRKFMARELNVEACKLNQYYDSVGRSREDMAYLDARMKAINANVKLQKLRDGEKSASEIEDMIKHNYIERGFKPDLIIIDYFECVAPEKGTMSSMKQHERELFTMRRIESMCSNLECGIWVATQATKDSYNADLITADKISGSTSKFNVSHICMTIMKTDEDRANNTATIAFLKNRAGGCGEVMTNVGFNNGTCRINSEGSEVLGFEAFKEKEEERQIRMRAYIGSLQYAVNQINDDIPDSNELEFFGGTNDDSTPF